jgi:hypothetical protein
MDDTGPPLAWAGGRAGRGPRLVRQLQEIGDDRIRRFAAERGIVNHLSGMDGNVPVVPTTDGANAGTAIFPPE